MATTEADDPETGVSDGETWDDLMALDYSEVQSRARLYDEIDGRAGHEEIAAGLLRAEGRFNEIPDEYRNGDHDEPDEDDDETPPAPPEAQADDDEDDEPVEDEDTSTLANEDYGDASFIVAAPVLESFFERLNVVVDEARIHLSDDGWHSEAVDPANVGMIVANLDSGAFESFDLDRDESVFGVSVTRVLTVLSGAGADDLVEIQLDSQSRNLVVSYEGHEFTIALIDPDSIRREPDLPDLDLPATGQFDGGKASTAVQFADDVSDHLCIRVDYPRLVFYAEGDTDSYEVTFESGDDATLDTNPDEAESLFSLEYAKPIIKQGLGDQEIGFELGLDLPIILTGSITHDDETVGDVTFMLAPRIRSN